MLLISQEKRFNLNGQNLGPKARKDHKQEAISTLIGNIKAIIGAKEGEIQSKANQSLQTLRRGWHQSSQYIEKSFNGVLTAGGHEGEKPNNSITDKKLGEAMAAQKIKEVIIIYCEDAYSTQ